MTVSDPPPSEHDTRRRLLEAACEVFAEHGFRAATVRDICHRAGANVAAVNYHFGDKETLYRTLFETTLQDSLAEYPPDYGLSARPTSDERLHAFVRSFLLRILSPDKPQSLMKMVMREMTEPTGVLEHVCQTVHKPLFALLRGIVSDVAEGRLDEAELMACCHSVVAQCVFYRHAEPVLDAMKFEIPRDTASIERLAEHVSAFSLAGIRGRAGAARKGARA